MLNTTTDVNKYLKSGTLTAPFLDTDSLKVRLKVIEKSLKKKKQDCDEISCLFQFLHSKLEFENENKTLMQKKFSRSAEEIFESRKMTGCTDCAYVFATLARQIGIPTTILQTSQKEWVNKFINGLEDNEMHYGHTFCECFVDGKWVLVDPTNQKIDWKYESENKVIKTEHKIGDSHTFLPYFRGLNLKEMSMKEF